MGILFTSKQKKCKKCSQYDVAWDKVGKAIDEMKLAGEPPLYMNVARVQTDDTPLLKIRFRRVMSYMPAVALFTKGKVYNMLLPLSGPSRKNPLPSEYFQEIVDFALEGYQQTQAMSVPPEPSFIERIW